jgi:hypothetical protein
MQRFWNAEGIEALGNRATFRRPKWTPHQAVLIVHEAQECEKMTTDAVFQTTQLHK